MSRTVKWPPIPVGGRLPFVEGVEATTVLVINVLSDLTQNPFNPPNLSLGEVTFRSTTGAEARIRATMQRLSTVVFVDSVSDTTDEDEALDGVREYTIVFTDRETRQQTEITVNG